MNRFSTVRLPLAVVVVVSSAAVAVMLGTPEAALFGAPWLTLLALGLPRTAIHRLRARVDLDADRIMVGEGVELTVLVEPDVDGWVEVRPIPGASWGSAGAPPGDEVADGEADLGGADETDRSDDPADVGTDIESRADTVRAGRRRVIRCRLPPPGWGTHDAGRVEVRLHERYGLFEWAGGLTEPRPLRVHPRPIDLRRLLGPWLVRRQTGVHESTAVDRGIEFADIRPFGAGDSLRDVNWRASARADGLLVSQRHPDRSTDLILLVDSFVESGHDVRASVGLAVEAALALAESHLGATDRVGIVELGGVVRWVSPGTGRRQLHRLTDALLGTRLYANATDRDLSMIPPRALPPRSFVVALTPLLDERFVEALVVLRGGGHDVAVIESVYEPVPTAHEPTEVAAAALRWFEAERSVIRARLIERGIAVGRWHGGRPLGPVLDEVMRGRRLARGARR